MHASFSQALLLAWLALRMGQQTGREEGRGEEGGGGERGHEERGVEETGGLDRDGRERGGGERGRGRGVQCAEQGDTAWGLRELLDARERGGEGGALDFYLAQVGWQAGRLVSASMHPETDCQSLHRPPSPASPDLL